MHTKESFGHKDCWETQICTLSGMLYKGFPVEENNLVADQIEGEIYMCLNNNCNL